MKNTKRILSVLICVMMVLSMMNSFVFAAGGDPDIGGEADPTTVIDYDAVRQDSDTIIINNAWTDDQLTDGQSLQYYFRGTTYTETYDANRHFNTWANAYAVYTAKLNETNIGSYVPAFIFAPGTYSEVISIHGNAYILGANAGINPNDPNTAWDYTNMSAGWPTNPDYSTANETILAGGILRGTRENGAQSGSYAYYLEKYDAAQGSKSTITCVADGVVFTGNKGFGGQDWDINASTSNAEGTDTVTTTGGRTEYRVLQNSYVRNYSGTNFSGLFVFWDTSAKYNYAQINNVRFDTVSSVLFYKYMKGVSIYGCDFKTIKASPFGTNGTTTDMAFAHSGNASNRDSEQTINFTHSVWANNNIWGPFLVGYSDKMNAGTMTATYEDSIFYNMTSTQGLWGTFVAFNKKKGATVKLNILNNQFYQSTAMNTLMNQNAGYQVYPTYYTVRGNKFIANFTTNLLGNMIASTTYPDVGENFWANSADAVGKAPTPVMSEFPNGFDMSKASYYFDSAMTTLNTDLEISALTEGTSNVYDITYDNALKTVSFSLQEGSTDGINFTFGSDETTYKFYSDSACTSEVSSIVFDVAKAGTNYYYLKTEKNGYTNVYAVTANFVIDAVDFATLDDGTITGANSVVLDSAVAGMSDGEEYIYQWGNAFYRCTVGTNIFASQAAIAAARAAGTTTADTILISANSLDASGDLAISIPGKFYSLAYNICPYVRGTALNGTDWTDNEEFTLKSVTARNIYITVDVTGGDIEVAGVTMTGLYRDLFRSLTNKTGDTNITLTNIVATGKTSVMPSGTVTSETNGTYLFRMGNTVVKDAANNDSFTANNLYIKGSPSGYRFVGEWVPKTTTFDGLYIKDPKSFGMTSTAYIKNAASGSVFTVQNSNLQDFYPELTSGKQLFEFEGFDKADRGDKTSAIVFDNNILNNFAMRTGGGPTLYMVRWYGNSYSDFTFTNNYVSNSNLTSIPTNFFHTEGITTSNYTQGGNVTIQNNVFNNFTPSMQIDGGGKLASFIYDVRNNFCANSYNADLNGVYGVGFSVSNDNGSTWVTNPYYVDYTMTVLNTDLELAAASAGTSNAYDVVYDNTNKTIGLSLKEGSTAGISFTFNDASTAWSLYSDADCTAPVSSIAFDVSKIGNNLYYLKAEKNGYSYVYTVTATFVTDAVDFSTLNDGELTADNSVILDPSCASYADGETYVAQWNGAFYLCTVGTNVFATQDAILAAGKNTTHNILVNAISGDWTISVPGKYLSPAYNICPYIRGTAADGSDWTDNAAYVAKSPVVGNITVAATVSDGTLELSGFTFTGNFLDKSRPISTNKTSITLNNMLKNGTTGSGYLFQMTNSNSSYHSESGVRVANNPANCDELYVKNLYIKNGNGWRLIGEEVPPYVTFDGLYCDAQSSNVIVNNRAWIKAYSDDSVFTIKNSNLRNWCTVNVAWQAFNSMPHGDRTAKIVFDNNILYNYVQAVGTDGTAYMHYWVSQSYTGFELTNNYVYVDEHLMEVNSSIKNLKCAFFNSSTVTENDRTDGSIIITGNTFIGMNSNVDISMGGNTFSKENMTIDHNFCVTDANADLATAVGVQITITPGNGTYTEGSGGFWFDYARTMYSDVIYDMSIDEVILNSNVTNVITVNDAVTYDLSGKLVNSYKNKIAGYYSDPECETAYSDASSISLTNGTTNVYLKVSSPDGNAVPVIYHIAVRKEGGFTAGIAVADPVKELNETQNQISWRGLVTPEGTYAIDFDTSFSIENGNNRVGIIYMKDTQDLDAIKAAIESAAAGELDTVIADINSTYSSTSRAYSMSSDKAINYWNDEYQAFTYRYNFNIKPDQTRYAVTFVVYEDYDGTMNASFSVISEQISTVVG